ncbi:MAG: ATP-binding cassette domain-containing protein [Bacteroidales bacterium]|jgi:ABC-type lipoprotein export system ATPase subunit|nr:ATP-binding cassette domain-containing protein [Bacteroidales bacterium]
MNSIRLSGVTPRFLSDNNATSDIWRQEVAFRKGDNYLVAAHSGSGKSSLVAYICGERTDYSGDILLDDHRVETLKPRRWNRVRQQHISCIFQGLRLFADLSAWENIVLKNNLTNCKSNGEIMQMIETAGLSAKKDEKAGKLSFGQQQRIAIIRALCQPFDFLLADEPFSHLDDANISVMSRMMTSELHRQGAGMILCSLGASYPFAYRQHLKL